MQIGGSSGSALGGAGSSAAEKAHPSTLLSQGSTLTNLPTGGISGPLAPHGMRINPQTEKKQQASPPGPPGPPGGLGGVSAGGAFASWGRGAFARAGVTGAGAGAGTGAAPRRQRHKVSSKDLTEEQRIERRLVPAEMIILFCLAEAAGEGVEETWQASVFSWNLAKEEGEAFFFSFFFQLTFWGVSGTCVTAFPRIKL